MKIAIIVEGKTERVFMTPLRGFLETRLAGRMPRLDPVLFDGPIPKGKKLKRLVRRLLNDGPRSADAVIGLTDVYTGRNDFETAADAKEKMRGWVEANEDFFPHAAQFEFEAWLLPYWPTIQRLAGHNRACPSAAPEAVNHKNPPSRRISQIFRIGKARDDYVKTRDAPRILRDQDLLVSARACPELKALLNTILRLCGTSEDGLIE